MQFTKTHCHNNSSVLLCSMVAVKCSLGAIYGLWDWQWQQALGLPVMQSRWLQDWQQHAAT